MPQIQTESNTCLLPIYLLFYIEGLTLSVVLTPAPLSMRKIATFKLLPLAALCKDVAPN